jgi:hypothetical protein
MYLRSRGQRAADSSVRRSWSYLNLIANRLVFVCT